jgi:hypothetical protein
MTDKADIQVTGKSKEEVAHQMAIQILVTVENKKLSGMSRKEYLDAHTDAVHALRGSYHT